MTARPFSFKGCRHTPESRAKMRARVVSIETRRKISEAMRGRRPDPAALARRAAKHNAAIAEALASIPLFHTLRCACGVEYVAPHTEARAPRGCPLCRAARVAAAFACAA